MNNISYFKLQAKNFYRDFKLDFMCEDEAYMFSPKFYDVNRIITDFVEVDINDFSLMKAQHVIAKLVGFKSWDELIKASDTVLEEKKNVLDSLGVKVKKSKVYHIDFSKYEKMEEGKAGDYLVKCPKLKELEEIITLKPDAYFMSCGKNINNLSEDAEHFYVNVCPRTSSIRVLVPGKKYPDWYAVGVKNI